MDPQVKTKNIPTVFIIFGATGDLMAKKIVPALYHLYEKGKLPQLFKIIGFSRRPWNTQEFQSHVRDLLHKHATEKRLKKDNISSFLQFFIYQQGDFETIDSYNILAEFLGRSDDEWKVCSNKLFYLAVPPSYYKKIFEHLSTSGLTIPCSPEEGFTRVVVEKPFGKNLATAEDLDALLGKLFKEEQVYRIDHYLAKEMLQNILSFRFSNSLFEKVWNAQFIEKIEIRLLEEIGAEGRGAFYDGVGALRDVGQNHILQMLALTTMDQPISFQAQDVRKKRAEILKTLHIPSKKEIEKNTFRAQYLGYKDATGVEKDSTTETYFKVKAFLNASRWEGVPIILESGKKLSKKKEIIVTFKHPTPCLCPPSALHYKNRVVFSVEPKEEINVEFWAKKPGLEFEMEKQTLSFLYRDNRKRVQYVEEYEKLLLDCILGNQLLFTSTDEVSATWKFIDPIFEAWRQNLVPLRTYKPHTKEVFKYSQIIEKEEMVSTMKKEVAVVGLGKMGGNIARRLLEKGWKVVAYNRTAGDTDEFVKEGGIGSYTITEFVQKLAPPRVVLLSLPAGKATEEMIFGENGLAHHLSKGDIIVDGANGYFKQAQEYAEKIKKYGIHILDAGISGGPGGARLGACIMVGGQAKVFEYLKPLFQDMATEQGVQFFEGHGAGHFVKMVHNGIEYGMMQSLAEGFTVLKKSDYKLDLTRVTDIYNHKSVIESRLVGWLKQGFEAFGENLNGVSGTVAHTGEGTWTVQTAKEMKIPTPVIEDSLKFRIESEKKPSYTGKILSALRNMFGGHSVK